MCLGLPVRASSWKNDSGPCYEHSLPVVGLHVDLEFYRSSGCQSSSTNWTVSIFIHIMSCAELTGKSFSDPIIQYSQKNTTIFVYLTLAMSFISYARFCTLVIQDITNYMGIACFTVRKKDSAGVWRDTKELPNGGKKA